MSRVSSSKMTTTSTDPHVKRRRGRQPRPCTLSQNVRAAARQFAASVGAPRVIEPAGFRDFVGWLQHLSSAHTAPAWAALLRAVLQDCNGNPDQVARIQPDVVREIIANVIVIRDGESSKLISTNARRQSTRPDQGMTLMKIFDKELASARRSQQRRVSSTLRKESKPTVVKQRVATRVQSSNRPPMAVPRRHTNHGVKLPSMRELEESIRR